MNCFIIDNLDYIVLILCNNLIIKGIPIRIRKLSTIIEIMKIMIPYLSREKFITFRIINKSNYYTIPIVLFLFLYFPFKRIYASIDFHPFPLLVTNNYFSHHILIAEKSTHTLHLFKNTTKGSQLLMSFKMATGKKSGNKKFRGDYKTPEGIYQIIDFIPHKKLMEIYGKAGEIYGIGSFVLDYPNPIDRRKGKTGGGIWIHSTNDETRIEKGQDSRGCIVIANNDLKTISQYIELGRTFVVVVQSLYFYRSKLLQINQKKLQNFLNSWMTSWRNEDFPSYIKHYHQVKFFDRFRGDFINFKKYKKNVFLSPGKPEIKISEITILQSQNYAAIIFLQDYKSHFQDIGKKVLYLEKDEYYNWKVVAEIWNKHTDDLDQKHVSFKPSMRFFKTEDNKKDTSTQ